MGCQFDDDDDDDGVLLSWELLVVARYSLVPLVGISQSFDRSASDGRWVTICWENWGQSPPEMMATWATRRSWVSARPMDSLMACLLMARVPSRSNATSCIIVVVFGGLFRKCSV